MSSTNQNNRDRNFFALLSNQWKIANSLVCIGLDTDYKLIPDAIKKRKGSKRTNKTDSIFAFNKEIIDSTAEFVCCFKLQIAFYSAEGNAGLVALRKTINYLNKGYPYIPIILDAKRGDIGTTAEKYATELFDIFNADAVTLNPYLGREAYLSFLSLANKGLFFLCHTSNPGAGEFQELLVNNEEKPEGYSSLHLFEQIAQNIASKWNVNNNCGLVIGATFPEQLSRVRQLVGDMTFLIPGIGAQGGDIEKTVQAGVNSHGTGMIISSSRSIIYASDQTNFEIAARKQVIKLNEDINRFR